MNAILHYIKDKMKFNDSTYQVKSENKKTKS